MLLQKFPFQNYNFPKPVADLGFPDVDPLEGMDLRRGHFSVKINAKTKELRSIGGVHQKCFMYIRQCKQ